MSFPNRKPPGSRIITKAIPQLMGKLLFARSLELSLRDQCAHWSWQSPNNSGRFVRAFVRFSDISENPGDCHVASLLAMTAKMSVSNNNLFVRIPWNYTTSPAFGQPTPFPFSLPWGESGSRAAQLSRNTGISRAKISEKRILSSPSSSSHWPPGLRAVRVPRLVI